MKTGFIVGEEKKWGIEPTTIQAHAREDEGELTLIPVQAPCFGRPDRGIPRAFLFPP